VILGGVALAIGLFVIRPALRAKGAFAPPPSVQASPPAMIGAPAKRAGASETALTGTIEDDADPFPIRVPDPNEGNTLLPAKAMGLPLAAGFATAQADDDTEEDPVARLRKLIEDRREETVEILRGWMEETGEKA
jgi:flagellar M-ring protein FliF